MFMHAVCVSIVNLTQGEPSRLEEYYPNGGEQPLWHYRRLQHVRELNPCSLEISDWIDVRHTSVHIWNYSTNTTDIDDFTLFLNEQRMEIMHHSHRSEDVYGKHFFDFFDLGIGGCHSVANTSMMNWSVLFQGGSQGKGY